MPAPEAIVTSWQLLPADVEFLLAEAGQLPRRDETAFVTIDLGTQTAVRAAGVDGVQSVELRLSNSPKTGQDLQVCCDRQYLLRALELGFSRFSFCGQEAAILAQDSNRQYLWMACGADGLVLATDDGLRIESRFEEERVGKRLLSDGERQALGDNLLRVWREMGTLGMWMQAKSYTNRFAALAALIEAISSPAWLAGPVSLAVDGASHPVDRPVWNPQTGVLSLAGKPIRRKIRRYRHPSNVQAILNAFQNAGWPDTIANPLGDTKNGVKLHQAVHQLNQTLRRIRFSALEGAKFVTWLAAKSRNSKSSQSQLE